MLQGQEGSLHQNSIVPLIYRIVLKFFLFAMNSGNPEAIPAESDLVLSISLFVKFISFGYDSRVFSEGLPGVDCWLHSFDRQKRYFGVKPVSSGLLRADI